MVEVAALRATGVEYKVTASQDSLIKARLRLQLQVVEEE